jgi:hypothetical protein
MIYFGAQIIKKKIGAKKQNGGQNQNGHQT